MNCGQKEEAIALESCPSTRVSHAKDDTLSVPFESLSLCKVQQGFGSMCRPVFILCGTSCLDQWLSCQSTQLVLIPKSLIGSGFSESASSSCLWTPMDVFCTKYLAHANVTLLPSSRAVMDIGQGLVSFPLLAIEV